MHTPVLIGMANSPVLPPGQIAESLRRRRDGVAARIESMRAARAGKEPLEAFVGAIFDHGVAMIQAELAWIESTLPALEETTMQNYDIKKQRKDLYAPKAGDFEIVEVPPMEFLMVDGHGDPNTSTAYREAIEALYAASYAVRAVTRTRLGKVHTVGPLGLRAILRQPVSTLPVADRGNQVAFIAETARRAPPIAPP